MTGFPGPGLSAYASLCPDPGTPHAMSAGEPVSTQRRRERRGRRPRPGAGAPGRETAGRSRRCSRSPRRPRRALRPRAGAAASRRDLLRRADRRPDRPRGAVDPARAARRPRARERKRPESRRGGQQRRRDARPPPDRHPDEPLRDRVAGRRRPGAADPRGPDRPRLRRPAHVVLGELAPKTVAIQKAEAISLLAARPIIFFYKIMYPFIWLLNGSALSLVRMFGLKPATESEEAHSEEELRIILSESYESGKINQTEYGYVNRIFAFDDLLAREIMVPRTDMVCLYLDKPLEENLKIIQRERYTRFPVVKENKDNVLGMINTKQLFLKYDDHKDIRLEDALQPVLTVTEAIPVKKLLKQMQQGRSHMAILLDEYGGTSGLITIEDEILEEIVGDIRDEFDTEERVEIEKISDNHIVVDGKVPIFRINELLGTDIENEGMDSIGGWLYGQNSELKPGQRWTYEDLTFIVREKERHRIRKIEIIREPKVETDDEDQDLDEEREDDI